MDVVEAYFQEFDCHEWWQFSQTQWGVPIGCAMAYLVFVFAGPMVMKLLPDWKLKHTLALWNFLLAAFSILGFTVSIKFVVRTIQTKGFHYLVCDDDVMFGGHDPKSGAACYGAIGWVMTYFVLSKIAELIDTFFLVARKRNVIFLHWYHHLTVLVMGWYAYACANPSSIMFATINYGVHSIMYAYYGLCVYTKSLGFLRQPITSLQMVQMVAGVGITASTGYWHLYGPEGNCSRTYLDTGYYYWNLWMYVSYFLLFAKFYYDEYVAAKKKKKNEEKAQ
jgi:hypothetical protein